ncbi:hypothetical protein, partial [Bordetella pertussis]|uniref:hypothetical protein n=1 Tax=Bordetella pertussis TaxID=520 RepID=UPI000A3F6906
MRIAIQNLSRRRFVQGAGGLLLGLSLPPLARRAMAAGPQAGDGFAANAFVRIGADGRVTVLAKHLEMGQAAAQRWQVPADTIEVAEGVLSHPASGR